MFFLFISFTNNNNTILFSDIILNEISFNPVGSEHHTEFVEIFNNGSESVDLVGYKISDGSEIDGLVIYPGFENMILSSNSYCLIMDSSYPGSSDYYEELIPDSVLRVVIEDGSFGSYGFSNTLAETLFVYDNNNIIINSYTYSIDQEPGFSDEKINNYLGSSNSIENWSNSSVIDGTPGFKNSVSPLNYDLSLVINEGSIPNMIDQSSQIEIEIVIKNVGLNDLSNFRYNILLDNNLVTSFDCLDLLQINDSISFFESISFVNINSGDRTLKLELESEEDENLTNNFFEKDIFVNFSTGNALLSINEFKKNPSNEECEWIEIVNISDDSLLIGNFGFSDSNHNNYSNYISFNSDYYLQPDSFFVIAKDSSIFEFFNFTENQKERIETNSSLFPTLNNSEDKIFLFTTGGSVIDSIFYDEDSWYEDDTGKSIEKINPTLESNNSENWNICVNELGTPCKINSIYQNLNNSSVDNKNSVKLLNKSVSPNNDGDNDNLIINYNFESAFIYATAIAFNIKGQKVKQILNNEYKKGDGSIIWNCKDFKNYKIPIGAYILYFKGRDDNGDIFEFKKVFYVVK